MMIANVIEAAFINMAMFYMYPNRNQNSKFVNI